MCVFVVSSFWLYLYLVILWFFIVLGFFEIFYHFCEYFEVVFFFWKLRRMLMVFVAIFLGFVVLSMVFFRIPYLLVWLGIPSSEGLCAILFGKFLWVFFGGGDYGSYSTCYCFGCGDNWNRGIVRCLWDCGKCLW